VWTLEMTSRLPERHSLGVEASRYAVRALRFAAQVLRFAEEALGCHSWACAQAPCR
jgi:hypothetical protein